MQKQLSVNNKFKLNGPVGFRLAKKIVKFNGRVSDNVGVDRPMKTALSPPLRSQRMHRKIAPHPDDSHDYDQDLDVLGVTSHDDTGVDSRRVGVLAAKSPRSQQHASTPAASRSNSPRENDTNEDLDLHQLHSTKHETKSDGAQGWLEWLLMKLPPPPLPWERSREVDVKQWIQAKRRYAIVRGLLSEATLYKVKSRSRVSYHGERDADGLKDGRGACSWPDPPFGGGEEYLGLWRKDQPLTSGAFCWFNGDTYLGDFAEGGVFQGLGVYSYGGSKGFRGDAYWGSYVSGARTGLGVYSFTANEKRSCGGTYAGEWLKGSFHGLGSLTYSDGERFIGQWVTDTKHGLGRYTWGRNTEHAGDYYQGQVVHGRLEGWGASKMADGGYHKGYYWQVSCCLWLQYLF